MPRRNTIKSYIKGGHYHLYNRGVEKRNIFEDDRDYRVFLSFIKECLDGTADKDTVVQDLSKEIDLIAYCLMPNHFHLFVQQHTADGITKFMKGLSTRYAMYFNNRHDRVGSLFQGTYKASVVMTDQHLMHLTRYIHLNPEGIRRKYDLYPYSSYKYYFSSTPKWLKTQRALEMFSGSGEYADFVEGLAKDSKRELGSVAID